MSFLVLIFDIKICVDCNFHIIKASTSKNIELTPVEFIENSYKYEHRRSTIIYPDKKSSFCRSIKNIFRSNKIENQESNNNVEKEVWSNKIDFFLSSLGYSGKNQI